MTAHAFPSTLRPAAGGGLDLVEARRAVAAEAARDPGAALERLHAIVASDALRRLGYSGEFSGWSRPETLAGERPEIGALAAARSGDRVLAQGRQILRGASAANSRTAALARDRSGGGEGYLLFLSDGAHRRVGEPVFDRPGFHLDLMEIEAPLAVTDFHPIPSERFEATLAWSALLEEFLHAALDHGLLESFRAAAHAHITTRTRPWQGQSLAKATDDPHLVRRYGQYVAFHHALDGLLEEAAEALAEDDGGPERRRAATEAVTTARNFALTAAKATISGTIELLGAGAASQRFGFDLFWRDFTAHAVVHPPLWPAEAYGRALLTSLAGKASA